MSEQHPELRFDADGFVDISVFDDEPDEALDRQIVALLRTVADGAVAGNTAQEPGDIPAEGRGGRHLRLVARLGASPAPVLDRQLPAAAAGPGAAGVNRTVALRAADDQLVAELRETDDYRLDLTIKASVATVGALVELLWSVSTDPGVEPSYHRLVTPLARSTNERIARYGLGSIESAAMVAPLHLDWLEADELDVATIRAAFNHELYGVSEQAWQELAAAGQLRPELEDVIKQLTGG